MEMQEQQQILLHRRLLRVPLAPEPAGCLQVKNLPRANSAVNNLSRALKVLVIACASLLAYA